MKRAGFFIMGLALVFLPLSAYAAFPEKPVKILVGFAPGGMTDIQARILAKHAEKLLGAKMIVENMPGGGGIVSWTAVSKAEPDGYTLGFLSNGTLTAKYTVKDVMFTYKDFEPLANLATGGVHLLAKKDGKYDLPLPKLVAYIKEHPKEVRVGLSGAYNANDFTRIQFERAAGIELPRVPFKGDSEVITALLGGHIALGEITAIPAGLSLYQAGKINSLAVSTGKRDPFTPNVPTFKESGYDVVHDIYWSIAAPKGISAERAKILVDTIKKAMDGPEMQKDFKQVGVPLEYKNPQELVKIWEFYDKFYAQLSKELRIEPK
jgi:tripartite-type tricarboxylate transporter receptor subunit TctC